MTAGVTESQMSELKGRASAEADPQLQAVRASLAAVHSTSTTTPNGLAIRWDCE